MKLQTAQTNKQRDVVFKHKPRSSESCCVHVLLLQIYTSSRPIQVRSSLTRPIYLLINVTSRSFPAILRSLFIHFIAGESTFQSFQVTISSRAYGSPQTIKASCQTIATFQSHFKRLWSLCLAWSETSSTSLSLDLDLGSSQAGSQTTQ